MSAWTRAARAAATLGVALRIAVPAPAAAGGFTDVTESAGVGFRQVNGRAGEMWVIETMGGGAALFDADGDGDADLYLVQSGPLPWDPAYAPPARAGRAAAGGEPRPGNVLYRNERGGGVRFVDVTETAGVGDTGYGMGAAAGDVDGDGDLDLFVTNFGPDALYRNEGDGRFAETGEAAGLADPGWSTSAAFADVDADGDLDLYVAHYMRYSRESRTVCGDWEHDPKQYCPPWHFPGETDRLYRNRGDGTFEDVTDASGVRNDDGKGLGVVFGDYDDDGDPDAYVANDLVMNFLYQNRGDGTFENVALLTGAGYSEEGKAQAGMGTDMADFDGDGHLDLVVTNYYMETNTLYRNLGGGFFLDATRDSKIGPSGLPFLAWGTHFFDYDLDGKDDLFIANGHVDYTVHEMYNTVYAEQPNLLYRNLGGGRFQDVSREMGADFVAPFNSRGAAFGDLDGDGDDDLVVGNILDRPQVLRNDVAGRGHWVRFALRGSESNRSGVGARVTVTAGGVRQMKELKTGSSYLSQHELVVGFGLGEAARVDAAEIRWPSGKVQSLGPLEADRLHVVAENGA